MDREQLVRLWQHIALAEPGAQLRASGRLEAREHGFDSIPQPGFVGARYKEGGVLVLALNPSNGGKGESSGDLRQYELIRALQCARGSDLISAFNTLMAELSDFMPTWRLFEKNGINLLLSAHSKSLDDISFLNVFKFRTKNTDFGAAEYDEAWETLDQQISFLRPKHVIVLGNGLGDEYRKRKSSDVDFDVLKRARGDYYFTPEARAVIARLSKSPLF